MAEPSSPPHPEVLAKSSSNDADHNNQSSPSSLKKAASPRKKKQDADEDGTTGGNTEGSGTPKSRRSAYRNYMSSTQSRSRGANSKSKSTAGGRGSGGGSGRGGGNRKGGGGKSLVVTRRLGLGVGGGGGGRGLSNKTKSHRSRQPMSYSKATQLNSSSAVEADEKTRELFKGHEDYGEGATVKKLAEELFGSGSGISDNDLRRLIDAKTTSNGATYQALEETIANLKYTLSAVMDYRRELVSGAIDSEKTARVGWSRALQSARDIDADRDVIKNKVKQLETDRQIWKDTSKDSMRELGVAEEKIQALKDELDPLKEKLATVEQLKTEAMISMEVTKARSEANVKQIASLKEEVAALAAAKGKAVEQAKAEAAGAGGAEKNKLSAEISSQKDKVKELESQLQKKELEMQKLSIEKDAAVERATSKDRDLSELMKSLGDIQRSGQAREEEANTQRKDAEGKVSDLERTLADTRGEISVLTHEKTALAEIFAKAKEDLESADGSVKDLKNQIDGFRSEISSQSAQLALEKELRTRSEQKESEERTERIALSAQMMAMTKEHALMEAQLNEANEILEAKWRKQFNAQEETIQQKEEALSESLETVTALEGEIASLKEALNDKKSKQEAEHAEEISKLNGEIRRLEGRVKAEEEKIVAAQEAFAKERADFEAQLRDGAAERRKMHNTIQELRGNVRVFARVRPFLPGDDAGEDEQPSIIPKSDNVSLKLRLNGDEKKDYSFSFDRVFNPSGSQEAVFTEVSEFVQSALDGFNVCLFSYGQTGSGKTHTMQGSGSGAMRGIISRAIEKVGEYKAELEAQGWKYEMRVSFLEIYNETIRDLLRDEEIGEKKHEIKVNPDGSRLVTDLTIKPLEPKDADAVNEVMQMAAKYRTVGSTNMNDVSSRSHSVFTLHLTAVHAESNQKLKGMLNLCDLAGSERLKRSGASGDQAKEAVSINKSLSALTNVFVSIGSKAGHVPYRNSKLTWLLQPSLSGDGKTLMIVNLSPTEMSSQESLSSLRFASQVNKCELGAAKRSIQDAGDDDDEDGASASGRSSGRSTPVSKSTPSSRRSSLKSSSSTTPIKRVGSTSSIGSAGRKKLDASNRSSSTSNITPPRRTASSGNLTSTPTSATKTSRLTRPTSSSNLTGRKPPIRSPTPTTSKK